MNRFLLTGLLALAFSPAFADDDDRLRIEGGLLPVTPPSASYQPRSTELTQWVKAYGDSVNQKMSKPVTTLRSRYSKDSENQDLQRLTCQGLILVASQKLNTSIDGAIINNGGLRNTLPEGVVNLGNIYSVYPFDNMLTLLEVKGETLLKIQTIVTDKKKLYLMMEERPIDPSKTYRIVTLDYIAEGNDGFEVTKEVLKRKNSELLVREIMIEYLSHYKEEHS